MFYCDYVGYLKAYVGCKVEKYEGTFKFTQPVILQRLKYEFYFPKGKDNVTPGDIGSYCGEDKYYQPMVVEMDCGD